MIHSFAVILPAAGASARFGPNTDKLLARLGGVPVFIRTLRAFLQREDVSLIVIATRQPQSPADVQEMRDPRIRLCGGGECRARSVRNALDAVPAEVEWLAVHDAARPLVSQELIDRTLAAALEHGAAVPALAVTATIKQSAGPPPGWAGQTLRRDELAAVQTPQIMRAADLRRAYEMCPLPLEQITDDAQLLELAGRPVWLVPGEQLNVKITAPIDLKVAELLLREEP